MRHGADATASDADGNTVYHYACVPPRPALLAQLLRHDHDGKARSMGAVNEAGLSAAAVAVEGRTRADQLCLQQMLEAGSSYMRHAKAGGGTLIHHAVAHGTTRQLTILLEACDKHNQKRTFLDIKDESGHTPLCASVRTSQHECVTKATCPSCPSHTFSHLLTPSHTFSHLPTPSHTFSHLLTPSHTFSGASPSYSPMVHAPSPATPTAGLPFIKPSTWATLHAHGCYCAMQRGPTTQTRLAGCPPSDDGSSLRQSR